MSDFRAAIVGTNGVLVGLSGVAIGARVGRRVVLLGEWSWHDALITLAAVAASTFSVLQMISTRFGVGLRQIHVPESNMTIILKLSLTSRIFYFLCNWAVKHSLLVFYTTLTIDPRPRLSIYTMHIIAFTFGLSNILATLLQCIPLAALWSPHSPRRHCLNAASFNYFNSAFMLANDAVLYAMPLAFTARLHVRRAQRIAVTLLFMLGGLVLAASAARVYFVHQQAAHPDFTYREARTMMCAVVENHVAIIVACAPSVKVVLLRAFPGLAARFEKLVSGEAASGVAGDMRGSASLAMAGFERPWWGGNATTLGVGSVRPESMRTGTDESGKSRRESRKWWRAPSSWEVNRLGTAGSVQASTGSLRR